MTKDTDAGEHLLENRSLILGRSLLVGLAGVVPVPALDDMLSRALRRGLLRKVASSRNVDVDETALDILSGEDPAGRRFGVLSTVGAAIAALRPQRWARRLLFGAVILRQLDESMRMFQQATLFDHYCARHHLGAGIDEARARLLRAEMEEVARSTQRELLGDAFERALHLVGTTLQSMPRRLRAAVGRPEQGEAPEPAILQVVQDETRKLVRDVALHKYSRRLTAALDRRLKPPGSETKKGES